LPVSSERLAQSPRYWGFFDFSLKNNRDLSGIAFNTFDYNQSKRRTDMVDGGYEIID